MIFDNNLVQLYILNWKKVNKNSINLYNQSKQYFKNVKIINCDEKFSIDKSINHINLDDSYWYGGQFNECIKDVDPKKILGIIVGDTIKVNFKKLIENLLYTFNNYNTGIYTIDDKRSEHGKKNYNNIRYIKENLVTVINSDCGIWFINPIIHQKIKHINYHKLSPLGWGIDDITARECKKNNLLVLKDYELECDQIDHTRNYKYHDAKQQWNKLINYYNNL